MNCGRFEQELARLLAGEPADDAALLEHTASCDACAGSRDLVHWAALPQSERFDDTARDDADWERFDTRLRAKLDAENRRRRAVRRSTVWSAAAAVCIVAMLAGWVLWKPAGPNGPIAVVEAGADPAVADEVLDRWASGGASEVPGPTVVEPAAGWSVPDTDELDAEERDELLDWLRQEAARLDGGQA